MLSIAELETLATNLESDSVERKESLASPDRIRQAICAFANDLPCHGRPGYIFIGLDDDGRPVGLSVTDQLLLNLAGMRDDGNILPLPTLAIEVKELFGTPIAIVEVQPSEMPPVRFQGQVWIRVGPRRAIASITEERRLEEKNVAGSKTFDRRACPGASLDDLLLDLFRNEYLSRVVAPEIIAQNQRSVEEQLASLRFFDLRRELPTNAAILVLGKDPLDFIPAAYIQFVRFEGDSLTDPVQDEKQISGNLLTQLIQLDNLLPLQIRTARNPSAGLRHEDSPDYPLVAIRELTLNALLHRTYEATNAPVRINWFAERVEIYNPGGLYGQATEENFPNVSDYRNPVLAEAMKVLGYVEKFGTGIARANASLQANGNGVAQFVIEPSHVQVTVRGRQ